MAPVILPLLQPITAPSDRAANRESPSCCGSHTTRSTESPWVWIRLLLAIYLTGVGMTIALVINTTAEIESVPRWWLQAFLIGITIAVWALLGVNFLVGAWRAAKMRQAAMEMLILLAMLGALGYSIASVVRGSGAVYFEVICVLLIVYSLGQRLKNRVRESVRSKIESGSATGLRANVITDEHSTESRPVSSVRQGQCVVVYPGQLIPVDGIVHSGTALVRESALTGEPIAVTCRPGQSVSAATICLDAQLAIEATRDGDDRLIDHIHRAVENARRSPSSVESLAQRIAGWFLPVVASVATATLLGWGFAGYWDAAMLNAAAVLLVACPCALGLATPIAVWTALSRSAKFGLVCKHGDAVLSLAEVDCVCFDKTGTLTSGESYRPRYRLSAATHWSLGEIRAIVASVERTSDHPFAVALRAGTDKDSRFQVRDVHLLAGRGISAWVNDRALDQQIAVQIVSSDSPLAGDENHDNLIQSREAEEALASSTTTAHLDVIVDNQLVANVELEELIPSGLRDMFAVLRRLRVKTVVLSGDAQSRVDALPADDKRGGLTSFEKSEVVEELRQNHHVLFVGDGFNDAQAMATADVSVAAAWGTDFAADTADIIWTRRDFASLVAAMQMSRRVRATIRSNLVFAATYNTLGMALAATGWLNPIAAVLLMLASSLTVTLRASNH